jgi:hypothetical protein
MNVELPLWEIRVAWGLRALILATALWHVIQGAYLYSLRCAAAIGLMLVLAYLARPNYASLPFEVELVFLWWLVADMSLGRLFSLYDTSLWFDKALHLSNSILLGMVGFLVVYVLHFTGRLSASRAICGILIAIVTLGVGALWEIAEYLSDFAFGLGAQGSPLQTPLDDTMSDLILDGLGGGFGVLLGPLYMSSVRNRCRSAAFASQWAERRGRDAEGGGSRGVPSCQVFRASAGQIENVSGQSPVVHLHQSRANAPLISGLHPVFVIIDVPHRLNRAQRANSAQEVSMQTLRHRSVPFCALVSLAVPLLLASPATFAAGPAAPPSQTPIASQKVGAAKIAVTAEDHLAKAEEYKKKAAAYRAEATVHYKMLAAYKGEAKDTYGNEDPKHAEMRIHCEGYISKAEALAIEAEKFADFHRTWAAEMQGK